MCVGVDKVFQQLDMTMDICKLFNRLPCVYVWWICSNLKTYWFFHVMILMVVLARQGNLESIPDCNFLEFVRETQRVFCSPFQKAFAGWISLGADTVHTLGVGGFIWSSSRFSKIWDFMWRLVSSSMVMSGKLTVKLLEQKSRFYGCCLCSMSGPLLTILQSVTGAWPVWRVLPWLTDDSEFVFFLSRADCWEVTWWRIWKNHVVVQRAITCSACSSGHGMEGHRDIYTNSRCHIALWMWLGSCLMFSALEYGISCLLLLNHKPFLPSREDWLNVLGVGCFSARGLLCCKFCLLLLYDVSCCLFLINLFGFLGMLAL